MARLRCLREGMETFIPSRFVTAAPPPVAALLPIGHHPTQQPEKPRIVVAVFDVAQLVGHHVLDAGAGRAR